MVPRLIVVIAALVLLAGCGITWECVATNGLGGIIMHDLEFVADTEEEAEAECEAVFDDVNGTCFCHESEKD